MDFKCLIVLFVSWFLLSGCASNQNMPLVFGQMQTVGVSIGVGTSDQGADFVLGYKDKNVAIIPVTLEIEDGKRAQITSNQGNGFKDSLSVLGQFEVQSDTSQGNVGLGKFFATGSAAKTLADGFKKKLEVGANVVPSPTPTPVSEFPPTLTLTSTPD